MMNYAFQANDKSSMTHDLFQNSNFDPTIQRHQKKTLKFIFFAGKFNFLLENSKRFFFSKFQRLRAKRAGQRNTPEIENRTATEKGTEAIEEETHRKRMSHGAHELFQVNGNISKD